MEIVERQTDAHDPARAPLLILETVRAFLDAHELGSGALRAHRIGEGGGSNFSFLLERDDGSRYVLRRPPRLLCSLGSCMARFGSWGGLTASCRASAPWSRKRVGFLPSRCCQAVVW